MSLTVEIERGNQGGAATADLTAQWPITDQTTPLADLLGAATHDLTRWLMGSGWLQAAPIDWRIGRAAGPVGTVMVLHANVPVARDTVTRRRAS